MGTWLQLHLGWRGSFYAFITLAIIVWLRSWFLLKETRSSEPVPGDFSALIGCSVPTSALPVTG